jgi:hypothetical protein
MSMKLLKRKIDKYLFMRMLLVRCSVSLVTSLLSC